MSDKRKRNGRKKKRPGGPGEEQVPREPGELDETKDGEGTSVDKQKTFFSWSGELEHFQNEFYTAPEDGEAEEPGPEADDATLTEFADGPEGYEPQEPPIEAPPGDAPEQEPAQEEAQDETREIGLQHEVDPSDETHTDVLRVEESEAADANEPVSQSPAAPDPASGTQPSPVDETQTDVLRPAEPAADETQTDVFRPDSAAAAEAAGVETRTDLGPPAQKGIHDKTTEDFHERPTQDFEEVHAAGATRPQREQPAAPDLADVPEPIEETQWEVRPQPRAPRPSILRRAREFFGPRNFFGGVRADLRALAAAWKRSGKRTSTVLRADKNTGWWRRTVLQTAALFAIVVPIEMVVNKGQVGAFGVHPHPYWLIVLPMAGARGVVAGLLAATFASLLHSIGAVQALAIYNLSDLFTFSTMREPLLFFGVGFFAGELHDELALRYRKVSRTMEEVQERNMRLREQRDVLADANKLLERRIVDHSVQFGNLVVAAKRMENADRGEVFEIALDLVEEHCGAGASVLLLLGDGSLDYLCHRGWPDEELAERLAAARASGFVQRAIADGVSVNGFAPQETAPEGGPLVVAPLFDDNGLTKALLCLDEIPASRLNESTITIFFGIAEWLSAALGRLARDSDRPQQRRAARAGPMGEVYLGEPDDLGERLRLELERCARYGVPTSFLAIQAPQYSDTTREGIEAIDRFICMHFTGGLRPSDTIYKFGYPGCYLLVLAGTTVEGAEVVRSRLMRRVEYAPSEQVGRIEIFATGPDADAPDLVSLVERVARRFRTHSPLALDGTCPVQVPEHTRPGSVDDFIRSLRMETSLATRNSFALHVVSITAESAPDDEPGLLARHVRVAGAQTLRPTDGVYSIGVNQCAVLLPCTGGEEAATVAHRLVQAVRARDPDAPYGSLETQVLGLGEGHVDVGSFLQALAQQGGGADA